MNHDSFDFFENFVCVKKIHVKNRIKIFVLKKFCVKKFRVKKYGPKTRVQVDLRLRSYVIEEIPARPL